MKTLLYGAHAGDLSPEVQRFPSLELVHANPDVVVCYGGDGTLLSAELEWPGVPKLPIRNSRRGHRCMPHPIPDILARLAANELYHNEFVKLCCEVRHDDGTPMTEPLTAMNEINVHMGRINSAVRFKLWIDEEPFEEGLEIVGDGLVVSTPFGSTAYFHQITRGVFHTGLGIAFKYTTHPVNHLVVRDTLTVRVLITRGPAVAAYDNAPEFLGLQAGNELIIRKHSHPALILTWDPLPSSSAQF
ncbi:MAG: hypothetical protein ACLFV4_10635 [Candidatus Hydrogenedentota bacterium]